MLLGQKAGEQMPTSPTVGRSIVLEQWAMGLVWRGEEKELLWHPCVRM